MASTQWQVAKLQRAMPSKQHVVQACADLVVHLQLPLCAEDSIDKHVPNLIRLLRAVLDEHPTSNAVAVRVCDVIAWVVTSRGCEADVSGLLELWAEVMSNPQFCNMGGLLEAMWKQWKNSWTGWRSFRVPLPLLDSVLSMTQNPSPVIRAEANRAFAVITRRFRLWTIEMSDCAARFVASHPHFIDVLLADVQSETSQVEGKIAAVFCLRAWMFHTRTIPTLGERFGQKASELMSTIADLVCQHPNNGEAVVVAALLFQNFQREVHGEVDVRSMCRALCNAAAQEINWDGHIYSVSRIAMYPWVIGWRLYSQYLLHGKKVFG